MAHFNEKWQIKSIVKQANKFNVFYECMHVYLSTKYCCYNPGRSIFLGPPHTKIKMYVDLCCTHFKRLPCHSYVQYRRVYRINSSTFLFHTILPSTNNFFSVYVPHTNRHFWKSPSLSLPSSPISSPHSFRLSGCLCLFVIFFVFSSHGKKLHCVFCCAVCCCCCECVFFSMPMAFYYSLFGNCS